MIYRERLEISRKEIGGKEGNENLKHCTERMSRGRKVHECCFLWQSVRCG